MLVVLYFVPLGDVLLTSVTDPKPGLQQLCACCSPAASVQRTLVTTLRIAAITTVCRAAAGLPRRLRHACGQHAHCSGFMLFGVLLPFWISVLVRSFAWLTLLRGTEDRSTTALMAMGARLTSHWRWCATKPAC